MKQAVIALKMAEDLPDVQADYIGADKGALTLIRKGVTPVLSVGDFDSVSEEERKLIVSHSREVIRLQPIKDDSDSEHAVKEAVRRGYERIWLCGALGGRADHALVNLRLCASFPDQLYLYDRQNFIRSVQKGTYDFVQQPHTYYSFFTFDHAVITLEGFFYPLTRQVLTPMDTYTVSNEINKKTARLIVEEGTVLIMKCRDMQ